MRAKDIQNITSLRKKYPKLVITLSTNVVKLFESYLDHMNKATEAGKFFSTWILYLRTNSLDGIDLNWNNIEKR